MKRTAQIKAAHLNSRPAPDLLPVFDEADLCLGVPLTQAAWVHAHRRPNTRGILVTQAIMKFNSGKRVRFLSSTRWNDGSPISPAPRKFIPVQVFRRGAIAHGTPVL